MQKENKISSWRNIGAILFKISTNKKVKCQTIILYFYILSIQEIKTNKKEVNSWKTVLKTNQVQ